jgi:Arc/MetJ-type ribon-helix-helix transcriptional regulator
MTFDYGSPAELFTAKRKGALRPRVGNRRFTTAAEAIRFAVEDVPAIRMLGAWLQVGDERFDSDKIHRLYECDDYPLQRRTDDGLGEV